MIQMWRARRGSILVLACLACSAPALAAGSARTTIVSKKVTSIGNSVTIVSSGGTTVVTHSNSCTPGVTGYLYQSIVVLFGGGSYSVTQSTTCR